MEIWQINYKKWINDLNISKKDKIILHKMKKKEKKENFYKQLEFGTAGIRGIRGLGTNKMNVYLIRKITQGYSDYLINIKLKNKNNISVVIAYDTRNMSKEFALESAKVFSGNGIKVYFFSSFTSTPELSFAIRYLKANGGIVVTASHNPKEYSGYKVYNISGAQLSTKETKHLIEKTNKIKNLSQVIIDKFGKNIKVIDEKIKNEYINKIKKLSLNKYNKDLKITYTSLHGVGLIPIKKLFESAEIKYDLVKEQSTFDGFFPTVSKPNPEEKQALKLLIKHGEKNNSDLLLATDPDADRLGVMVKYKNKYVYITGNQIGGLLIDYILKYKKYDVKNSYIITSIVTSKFGAMIAKYYGVKTKITFTGFKNIGNKIENYLQKGKNILFAYEESIGYLPELFSRDKDGVSSAFLVSEMAGILKKEGKTLVDQLKLLYKKFGYYEEKQLSYTLKGIKGIKKIKKIMKEFRNKNNIFKNAFNNIIIKDYLIEQIDKEYSNLVSYTFKDNTSLFIRPSGTEPKLKIYINIIAKNKKQAKKKYNEIRKNIKNSIKKWIS